MTPGRKPPHCRTCHKPIKGHKRGICETIDASSPPPPPQQQQQHSASAGTRRKSVPLRPIEVLPTLSPQSSQILHDLLRSNSQVAPPIHVPNLKQTRSRRSRGNVKHEEIQDEVSKRPPAVDNENHRTTSLVACNAQEDTNFKAAITCAPTQTGITLPTVSQNLLAQTQGTHSPGFMTPQRTKFQGSNSAHTYKRVASASDALSADVAIQGLLQSISTNLQHPPATIFSFPADHIHLLKESVECHKLCMQVLSIQNPNDEWVPVIVGRNTTAIAKLLEDSETLAQGLRYPDKFKVHDHNLGMSHVVAGALGVLATWAGLAYS